MAPHAIFDTLDTSGYTPGPVQLSRTLKGQRIRELDSRKQCSYEPKDVPSQAFVYRFTEEDIHAIEAACYDFEDSDLPLSSLSPHTFPLGSKLERQLGRVLDAVYGEQKFIVVSGLDPFRYSPRQNVIIHTGISSHIGGIRAMPGRLGGDNTVLHHITSIDANGQPKGSYHGPPNQSRDLPMHTDNGDIVGLYTLSTSASGGNFYIARAAEVFTEMKEWSPKLARTLFEDWTMMNPSPEIACDSRPIIYDCDGKILINCSRARITGTTANPRPESLPAITAIQMQALDTLHAIAKTQATRIHLNAGDIVFFNNLEVIHGRDSFQDNTANGRKRHLLRLILRNEDKALRLPRQLHATWGSMYDHNVTEEVFPIEETLFTAATSH